MALMSIRKPTAIAITAALAAVILVSISAFLRLSSIPVSTTTLTFLGFVHLPKTGNNILNVMDYMIIHDNALFVASIRPGTIYKIPLAKGPLPEQSVITALAGRPYAHGIAFDPASGRGFVSRSGANTVDVFDPVTMRLLKRIPVVGDVDAIVFAPWQHIIYSAQAGANTASLIDPAAEEKLGAIALGGKPEFAVVDPSTHLLYQNLADANAVAVVDIGQRRVIDRLAVTGCDSPSGIALDAVQRRLFIACNGNDVLAILDLDRHRATQTLNIGGGPDTVAYDYASKRIFVTGRAGILTSIHEDDADSYRILDTIKLRFGAHTLAIDPVNRCVYVGYVSLFSDPLLAVFRISS